MIIFPEAGEEIVTIDYLGHSCRPLTGEGKREESSIVESSSP
jgi:hypothetical protein